jgi:hypothetical protein
MSLKEKLSKILTISHTLFAAKAERTKGHYLAKTKGK